VTFCRFSGQAKLQFVTDYARRTDWAVDDAPPQPR